jgi:hypothetical protein
VYIGREGATPQAHQQDGNGLAEVEAQPPHHQTVVGGGEDGQVHDPALLSFLFVLLFERFEQGLRLRQIWPAQEKKPPGKE